MRFWVFITLLTLAFPVKHSFAANLTSLLRRETSILTQLETIAAKVVRTRSKLEELKREKNTLKYQLKEAQRKIDALEKRSRDSYQAIRTRVASLYKLSRGRYLRLLVESKNRNELMLRAATLRQILKRDLGELSLYRKELTKLTHERLNLKTLKEKQHSILKEVATNQKELKTSKRYRRRLLAKVRRSRKMQQQMTGELSQVQKALLTRIARLEVRVRNAGGFAARKGRLPRPVGGAIINAFGKVIDKETGLSVLRSGVTFRAYRNVRIRAVYPGQVRLARIVAGYGNVVLIEHGDNYFTLYGFLSTISIKEGDKVRLGTVLGKSGEDPLDGRSALYFELRQGSRPLDPRLWFRN